VIIIIYTLKNNQNFLWGENIFLQENLKTNKNRTLEISGVIPIPLSKDVNFSYIDFNQENIIKQAFKKIGGKVRVGRE